MSERSGLIVDLTSQRLRCCLFDSRVTSKARFVTLNFPLRVVVRQEEELKIVSGYDAIDYVADDHTLVFHNFLDDLVELEDEDVKIALMESFWLTTCSAAAVRYQNGLNENCVGFIVYPHRYSAELLDVMRLACAVRSSPIRTTVFVHEASALILGLLDSGALESAIADQGERSSIAVGAVLAYGQECVELVCFDYVSTSQPHQIMIRDYVRTTSKKFHGEFMQRKWRNEVDLQFCVHSPGLPKAELHVLVHALITNRSRGKLFRLSLHSIPWLKCLGARRFARHSLGHARDLPQFEIVNANNIGVRLNQERFYPLLKKDDLAAVKSYPHLGAKAFRLSGKPEADLTVSLYAGYSDLVCNSIHLGSINVRLGDLKILSEETGKCLVAAVQLTSSGSGELVLGVMPDDRVIGRLPLTLPGVFC